MAIRLRLTGRHTVPGAATSITVTSMADSTIGSDPACTLRLPDPAVAPVHARLWLAGADVYLSSEGARLSVMRAGRAIDPGRGLRLVVGDLLAVGPFTLQVVVSAHDGHGDASPPLPADDIARQANDALQRHGREFEPVPTTRVTQFVRSVNRRTAQAVGPGDPQPGEQQADPRWQALLQGAGLSPSMPIAADRLLTPAMLGAIGRMIRGAFDALERLEQLTDPGPGHAASGTPAHPLQAAMADPQAGLAALDTRFALAQHRLRAAQQQVHERCTGLLAELSPPADAGDRGARNWERYCQAYPALRARYARLPAGVPVR